MSKNKLNLEDIRNHWKDWASKYKTDLRATTKTSTAKQIEINALLNIVKNLTSSFDKKAKILEVGCGNGYNLLALFEKYPNYIYKGIDFIEEMIASAIDIRNKKGILSECIDFKVGDILKDELIDESYDLIFTIRCIINLNNEDLQIKSIKSISKKIKNNGYFLMLENSNTSYENQNNLRSSVGLDRRVPADFNHFINDKTLVENLKDYDLKIMKIENFISLHDIVLYVLVPLINDGKVDYDHPIVDAATKLTLSMSDNYEEPFGDFGQNRLYLFKKV